jgi:hypothetical protein
MANIFQQLYYTPHECTILDFIKKNKDSIEYAIQPELEKGGYQIGTMHIVRIWNNKRRLEASITTYPNRDSKLRYFYTCTESEKEDNRAACRYCKLYDINYKSDEFASKVYNKMLKHYIRQHGRPKCR